MDINNIDIQANLDMTDHCTTDLSMMDDMLGSSPMYIKYVSYVYDRFCIGWTNFPSTIESAISKFTCTWFAHLVNWVKIFV